MGKAWFMKPLDMPAIAVTSVASGHSIDYLKNDHSGVVYKSAGGASSIFITVDMGAPVALDSALFFGCTGAQSSWNLTVWSADDGAFTINQMMHLNAGAFLAGATFPSHGRGVGYWESATVPTARRYWGFQIGNLANAQVVIARLALGRKVQLERNFGFGAGFGLRDFGSVNFSAQAVRIRRRAAKLRMLGLTFPAVTKDEAEQKVQPFVEAVAGQEPFVLVTDPDVSAQRQTRCWFGHLTGELGTVWRSSTAWEWRANVIDLIPIPKAA